MKKTPWSLEFLFYARQHLCFSPENVSLKTKTTEISSSNELQLTSVLQQDQTEAQHRSLTVRPNLTTTLNVL